MSQWKPRSDFFLTPEGQSKIKELKGLTGLSELTLRLCLSRGLDSKDTIDTFLNPKLENLKDPFLMKDMRLAVERLAQARESQEKILVYGDYDVDGTTGAALLTWFLRECKFNFSATQPDRFKDGYGLNVKAVQKAHADGVKILLTVDCGISSFDAALEAKKLGIELIVLDHHQVDVQKGLPEAYAIVNAQRADCESGLKELCGCGVAFYLIRALRAHGKTLSWWAPGSEPNLKKHLDLVVIATAADMVPLIGDNHILVRHGLQVLRQTQKPGVKALLEAAGISSYEVSPSHLGFTIGPRINASGRMSNASHAFELLTTEDGSKAVRYAHELERLNRERMDLQNQIWDQVRATVEAGLAKGLYKNAIVVGSKDWHEGVVGIVASKVTETYKKPAAVLALREDHGKGSVRSFGGKDILQALRTTHDLLLGYGGHKYAAGLSVSLENFESFVTAYDQAVGELTETKDGKLFFTEGECAIEQLDYQTLGEIERLGPFGPGNPEPVFVIRARAAGYQVLKERHLKLNLTPVGTPLEKRIFMDAIWFGAAERDDSSEAALRAESEWAAVPEINRFKGKSTPTLRIKNRRSIDSNSTPDMIL